MALEHVEILFFFGIVAFGLVVFQHGIRSVGTPDLFPIVNFNDAWIACLKEEDITPSQYDYKNIDEKSNLGMETKQGLLSCLRSKKIVGYHIYREMPDNWYDMDARKCDAQSWCLNSKKQNASITTFAWTCDGSRLAMIWQNHAFDPCPPELNYMNQTTASSNCRGGIIVRFSKMWLCVDKDAAKVTELAWILH
ncbi:hypothetical protein Ciccas_002121 [Cichlidogyrus casuarinus]|uniref:Uncharacterized protein n=1 Tax=Cichlidogyrus casuarinus TaxID=1844966 RepID=A0ABD2QI30_9PLAT